MRMLLLSSWFRWKSRAARREPRHGSRTDVAILAGVTLGLAGRQRPESLHDGDKIEIPSVGDQS